MKEPLSTVGVVGLGIMGSAMSAHLLDADFTVIGYDIDPGRIREHQERGGEVGTTPGDVASRSDAVITSLPSVDAFSDVVGGPAGLASSTGAGLVIDTSTLPLDVKLAGRDTLAEAGSVLLDCTISGTGAQLRDKDVAVYVSGDDTEAKQIIAPVLASFARAQYDVGSFGNGSKFKYIANLLVAIHNLSTAEAFLLAERAGLDRDLMLRVISDGAGSSRMFEVRGPLMIADSYDEATMKVEVFQKDLHIIDSFAKDLHSPTPLFTQATTFYEAAMAQGRAGQDTACLLAVLRQLAHGTAE